MAAALTCLVMGPVDDGWAASNGSTSFAPVQQGSGPRPFFQLSAAPGRVVHDVAVLKNMTDRRVAYDLYSVDASDIDGSFVPAGQDSKPTDVGAWVRIPAHHVVLAAHKSRRIPVTIRVPSRATPGDHAGAVVALAADRSATGSGTIRLHSRYGVGVRIYFRVAGPLAPQVAITDASVVAGGGLLGALVGHPNARVEYAVSNTGNVRLIPTSGVTVSPWLQTVHTPTRSLGEMLPGSSSTQVVEVHGLRWASLLGVVHATVTARTSATSAPVTATVTTYTIPWLLVLLLAGLAFGLWTYGRRSRRRPTGRGRHAAPGKGVDRLVEA